MKRKIGYTIGILVAGVVLISTLFVGAVVVDAFIFVDQCDPSENMDLGDMTTAELDALCGKDRGFRFQHEDA